MASSHQAMLGGGCRVFKQDVACGICEPNPAGTVQPVKRGPVRLDHYLRLLFLAPFTTPSSCPFPGLTAGRRWKSVNWSAAERLGHELPPATSVLSAAPQSLREEKGTVKSCRGTQTSSGPPPSQPTRVAISTRPLPNAGFPSIAITAMLWVPWILEDQASGLWI